MDARKVAPTPAALGSAGIGKIANGPARQRDDGPALQVPRPETAVRLSQYQRQSALQNHPANFQLPTREQAALYRVRSLGAKLVRRGGGWLLTTGAGRETLSADEAEIARWVLGRDCFNAGTLALTFDDHDAAALAPVVEKLIGAGLVQPL